MYPRFQLFLQNSKAYIILNKHTRKVEESLNVTFDETPPPSKTSPLVDDDLDEEEAIKVTEKKNLENDIEDETLEIDEIVNIKESRNHPLENVIGNLNQRTLRSQAQNQSNFFCFISTIEPKNVNEALTDDSWIVAMQEELNQFIANDVWELVPQPRNMTIIGTKWVFRNKLDENGIVSRNKARLVAQGYNQQEGIDYDETYAPVARLESIRILLAYACALDFKLFQMDVKSAFLNGFINEEVYVAQPPGFIDFEKPDHVYKLKKALYGLKQAPKAWSLNELAYGVPSEGPYQTNPPSPDDVIWNSTQASSSNPSKKIKLTIIPHRQLFVNISSDEDVNTTPSPTATSSSPTPPNAPSKTPSINQTSSSQENTSSSFQSKLQISPLSSNEPTSP
ncbi:retrovirus-related pol polyprotein from transposon TNT 1-94 [Tanacetum coccineum]|uniref:Retrovirus-related pol polyprotein from transposon TNT 1-94 n=1 Tax=Tanacetum coccineum TaxID=301880 RepID=A0ABQ5FB90_9ASTR